MQLLHTLKQYQYLFCFHFPLILVECIPCKSCQLHTIHVWQIAPEILAMFPYLLLCFNNFLYFIVLILAYPKMVDLLMIFSPFRGILYSFKRTFVVGYNRSYRANRKDSESGESHWRGNERMNDEKNYREEIMRMVQEIENEDYLLYIIT